MSRSPNSKGRSSSSSVRSRFPTSSTTGLVAKLDRVAKSHKNADAAKRLSLEQDRASADKELDNLTKLRIRDLVWSKNQATRE